MRRRLGARYLICATVLATSMVLGPAAAMAHPVSQFGEPNCFGTRISHGSASIHADGHELTPAERVVLLQEIVDFILAEGSPEEVAIVEEFFGETVELRELIKWVKVNCSDDPILLPFL